VKQPTPTSHGNWQVIKGRLVDVDKESAPASATADQAAPQSKSTQRPAAGRTTKAKTKRKPQ
jgi:hypothetical protein